MEKGVCGENDSADDGTGLGVILRPIVLEGVPKN